MTSCNTFSRSVAFAAVASLAWIPWALLVAPAVGLWWARALYLVAITSLYVAGLSTRGSRRLAVVALTAIVGGGFCMVAQSTSELAIGLAAILGVSRAIALRHPAPVRTVMTETVLLLTGLLFARGIGGFSLLSTGAGIWAFFLVQSLSPIVAGVPARASAERSDLFEEAYQSVVEILDQ